ncbi:MULTISPECIES: NEL-type E3 ubiquitin ligase domain-containing protein [Pseudomonas]|uniref:NEL-type E3 ubiquitin ligase domain-containing protein n=1 Tax=Pseudomonas TaxID=286 RepID=UPI001CEC4F85|nr:MULTISPECIES: NEL-type E3 ubiquitin ligase domain-containing protein [Pseudomonas]MDT3746416.1 NEL-type E3 ubiquitin ligase domain-containing protein [Pseudomonas kurunegalensis]
MTTPTPLHKNQITRALPKWSKALHPAHTQKVVQSLRRDYLAEDGTPYPWYATADAPAREQLRNAIKARNKCLAQLKAALAGFKDIITFSTPLLTKQLNVSVPVDRAQYVFQPFEADADIWTGVPDLEVPLFPDRKVDVLATRPMGEPQARSLLEAALHNFESLDEVGAYSRLTCAPGSETPLPGLTMADFVKHCRALDLGQRYQDHLLATHEGANRAEVQRLSIQASREALRVQALIAKLKGLLSDRGGNALIQLCDGKPRPTYDEQPLRCWNFSLFGIPIHEILFIGPDEPSQINPCIVYIPEDNEHPVREFASLQAAGKHLRRRLLQRTFRRALVHFAYKDRQQELADKLENALFEKDDAGIHRPRHKPVLHFTPSPIRTDPWATLYNAHLARMKADAKIIAVPTADVDAKARNERLKHWLDIGMTVLNVAAFFVPGLNTVMLGVFAYDLMSSVFTGFEAWEEGDTQQALVQLESLAINAAVIAGFAVGAKIVQASGFVDALTSVWHDDQEVLWHPDMKPYASPAAIPEGVQPDSLGHVHVDGKTYLKLNGTLYEVFQDAEQQWRVRHPEDAQAYAPRLLHQGDARWQLDHEQPLEWDHQQLMSRLGNYTTGLDKSELDYAMRSTGTDESVLRRNQATGSRPPALLIDTLQRLQLDNEARQIIDRVRHGLPLAAYKDFVLPELLRLPGWSEGIVLKVYKGPEPWGESMRYGPPHSTGQIEIEVTRSDLENGQLSQTVLAQMDEEVSLRLLGDTPPEQRSSALNNALATHLEAHREALFSSLQQSRRPVLPPAAHPLARQFPGLPDSALEALLANISNAERLSLTNGRVPLRIAEEARRLQARARLDRAILGMFRRSLANDDSQRLKQALQAEHPQADSAQLLQLALADRQRCASLLGQQPVKPSFRSPLRMANGQLGYPLSGRGLPAARRLRALYPELSSPQISALQADLAQGGDLGIAISRLEAEQRTLSRDLNRWANASASLEERFDRQQCAERLMSASRREGGAQREALVLDRMRLEALPTFTARMPHIRQLTLEGLQLRRLDSGLLSNFPNLEKLEIIGNPDMDAETLFEALKSAPRLRELGLTSNGLTALTATAQQAIEAMPGLRILGLSRNRLQLDDASLSFLARLPLDALGLGNNQITLDETLAARFQDMIHPMVLHMPGNPLQQPPDLRFMARLSHLDLERCELQQWPDSLTTLMSQPQYQLRYLNLSSNRIRTLPDLPRVLRTPFARDVAARLPERRWLFNYNTLEAQTRARLGSSGVNVFEHAEDVPQWQSIFRGDASNAEEQLWSDLFDQGENAALLGVLERLAQSAEALRDAETVSERVWDLLEKAAEDTELRERLATVAGDFPPTCGDAGADAFSALEIEVLAHEAAGRAGSRPTDLLRLYRKLYRRDQVNQLADRISWKRSLRKQALLDGVFDEDLPAYDVLDEPSAFPDFDLETGLVDDIEVRLALRQSLATALDYPEPSRGMLYRDTARINQTIIDRVKAAVLALDTDANAREQWLNQQPGWVEYLKREHAAQFSLITDFWRPGLDYLYYCLDETADPVTSLDSSVLRALAGVMPESPLSAQGVLRRVSINEQQYRQGVDVLTAEQQQVETGLLTSLTRQAQTLGG